MRTAMEKAGGNMTTLHKDTFHPGLLEGTGSELWRALWEAARRFSTEKRISPTEVPVMTDGDVRCVLCQQQFTRVRRRDFNDLNSSFSLPLKGNSMQLMLLYRKLHQGLESLAIADELT